MNDQQTDLRDRIAEALHHHLARTADIRPSRNGDLAFMPEVTDEERMRIADEVLAVLPPPADRAAVLLEAAEVVDNPDGAFASNASDWGFIHARTEMAAKLRRLAAEAQQQPDTETRDVAEDPARIDRLRPEFTDHASTEAIDAQLQRARAQERRWHIRVEWLIGLRQARAEQKARGEQPAAVERSAAADTLHGESVAHIADAEEG